MTGNWPPEWDDPEDGDSVADEAQLAEVSAWLAAAPAPVLPDAVADRIMAALAAESVRSVPGPREPEPRVLGPAPDRARVRRRRNWLTSSAAVVVCLLFVGLAFAVSHGSSASSSSAASGTEAGPASAGQSAGTSGAPAYSSAGRGEAIPGPGVPLTVTESGTRYTAATLASQVRGAEARPGGATFSQTNSARPSASSAAAPSVPSAPAASAAATTPPVTPALRGCVLRLTGGKAASLIDRATYDGAPAYVIATRSQVWVVGLGCTKASLELVTSVSLAG